MDILNMWNLEQEEHGNIRYQVNIVHFAHFFLLIGDLHVSTVARSKSLGAGRGERGHRCRLRIGMLDYWTLGPSVRAEFGPTITWEMGFQLGLFERVAEATPHLALFPALAAEPEKADGRFVG